MFRRDWFKHPKARLIAGLALASVFCFSIVGMGYLQAAEYERHAHNRAEEYAEYTGDKVAQACIGIAPRERIVCLNDAYEAQREYENNQADLTAQKKSALWAFIMGAAAVVGMALSAVGVWLVKRTFDETRRGADEAERSRISYIESERGHLVMETPDARQKGDRISISLNCRNIGRSVTVVHTIDYSTPDGPIEWELSEEGMIEGYYVKIAADSKGSPVVSFTAPDLPCTVIGRIRYRTLSLPDCHSHFSFRMTNFEAHGATQIRCELSQFIWLPDDT